MMIFKYFLGSFNISYNDSWKIVMNGVEISTCKSIDEAIKYFEKQHPIPTRKIGYKYLRLLFQRNEIMCLINSPKGYDN